MRNTKTNTKKNNAKWYNEIDAKDMVNHVTLFGKVKKIFVDTDKVQKFSLEIPRPTDNGKIQLCWLTCVNFDDERVDENDNISIVGYLSTNHYNDTWTTEVIITSLTIN